MQRECREIPSLPTIILLPVLGRDDSFIRGANNVDIISFGNDVKERDDIYGHNGKYSYEYRQYF